MFLYHGKLMSLSSLSFLNQFHMIRALVLKLRLFQFLVFDWSCNSGFVWKPVMLCLLLVICITFSTSGFVCASLLFPYQLLTWCTSLTYSFVLSRIKLKGFLLSPFYGGFCAMVGEKFIMHSALRFLSGIFFSRHRDMQLSLFKFYYC